MEKEIKIGNVGYQLIKEYKDGLNETELLSRYTDYFDEYDYIFGDYSYDKLRLKGFYKENNKNAKEINNILGLEEYIKNYCAYECRYFLLEKVDEKTKKNPSENV